MPTLKLTEKALAELPLPSGQTSTGKPRKQEYYWDEKLTGFGVIVGHTGHKTFVVSARVAGARRKIRVKIGAAGSVRADGHRWTVTLARRRAREVLGELAAGVDPNAEQRERRGGPTLRDGLELHLAWMRAKERRPSSIDTIEREVPRYLRRWLDTPLADISRRDCRARHRAITTEHGPYIANRVMRHFRALWNTTDREQELPKCPTIAVHWNKERRRQEPIPWEELPAWRQVVEGLHNEVRRDFNLFLLFTGLRRMDGATVRWEHLDLEAATLHRPNPKGGADRAFTIPISAATVEILRRRRAENPTLFPEGDAGWCFPTRATRDKDCHLCAELGAPPHRKMAVMHLVESKEQRVDRATGEVTQLLPSAHRLRDTYTSAAAECGGLSPFDIDVLTNHRPPRGSVTAGYVNLSMEHLAECQERVTAFLLSKLRPAPELRIVRTSG